MTRLDALQTLSGAAGIVIAILTITWMLVSGVYRRFIAWVNDEQWGYDERVADLKREDVQ